MELVAPEAPGFRAQPAQEGAGVAAPPCVRMGREVVDVERARPPGQVVQDAEARDRDRLVPVLEGSDEPVALGTLDVVHPRDECVAAGEVRPQRAHGRVRQGGLSRKQLAYQGSDPLEGGRGLSVGV